MKNKITALTIKNNPGLVHHRINQRGIRETISTDFNYVQGKYYPTKLNPMQQSHWYMSAVRDGNIETM